METGVRSASLLPPNSNGDFSTTVDDNTNGGDFKDVNTKESQCGKDNELLQVLIALVILIPLSVVLVACCCCSCCAFCACLKPSRYEHANNNLKSAKTRVYFESKLSQESTDSMIANSSTCPLFPSRTCAHPPIR